MALAGALLLGSLTFAAAQRTIPSTFPHDYPGKPTGDFGPNWQKYFSVNTSSLPNVSFPLTTSFSGNIPVDRAGHPNDTLFFWAFEKVGGNGSLTAAAGERQDEPWLIWLNGGPGSSSLLGMLFENGPLHVANDFSVFSNNFSWNTLADAIWIDQPVGTGFSTADRTGYIDDEDQMGRDFAAFLANLVKVFPSLSTRPLYLTGESYAGVYIPYITKTLLSMDKPPVSLRKISIGDGAIAAEPVFEDFPTVSVLETYPQLIDYDHEVLAYFQEQTHLCGYDLNLTYPQTQGFSSLLPNSRSGNSQAQEFLKEFTSLDSKSWTQALKARYANKVQREGSSFAKRETRAAKRELWKRDLSQRANGTIDPQYECFILFEMFDYVANFTFPWINGPDSVDVCIGVSSFSQPTYDLPQVYNLPDALSPEAPADASVFLNDNRTRTLLHAPTSKNWTRNFNYPFGSMFNSSPSRNQFGDPSPEPMVFLDQLWSNATAKNVSIIFYSGNDDGLVGHRGTEATIQNITFGGIRGFTKKPSTPWFEDNGRQAGIVHQERDITYALFFGAGHLVPELQPAAAHAFLREFILGSNNTGAVGNDTEVVGGEDPAFQGDIVPGNSAIFYGPGTTISSLVAPSASQASWASFLATATLTPGQPAPSGVAGVSTGAAVGLTVSRSVCFVLALLVAIL